MMLLFQPAPGELVSGAQRDAGPPDRYATPYTPITYGRETLAPLPGFARAYEPIDWDGDGLTDILALERRGGGLKLYRNVGEPGKPLFTEPRHAPKLMDPADFGGFRWFALGTFESKRAIVADTGDGLSAIFNDGEPMDPQWRPVPILKENGERFDFGGRFTLGDLAGDGRDDLVICTFDEFDATDIPKRGRKRLMNSPPPHRIDPNVGKIWLARNVTTDPQRPTFAEPELVADDVSMLGYPAVLNNSTFVVSGDDNLVRVFERNVTGFREVGALSRLNDGEPHRTSLVRRVRLADFGHGPELLASGYFGNNARYVRYAQEVKYAKGAADEWFRLNELQVAAKPDTPVHGIGNSTVDVVDLDGNGTDDLLLGGEPGLITVARNVGTNERPEYDGPHYLKYVDGSRLETFCIVQSPTVGSFWGPSEWYSDRLAPRAVDWDGDGTLDLVSGSMGRRLYFFKGVRVEGELRFERPVNFRFNGEELDLPDRLFPGTIDWNGDGHPDLIVSNDAGHVLLYPGDGTLDLGEPTRLGDIVLEDFWERKKGNRSGFAVAPWTGPGKRDLIIYQFHRGVFLFRDLGGGRYGKEEPLFPMYSHLAGPTVYDYDRNGTLDLVVGGDERRMIEVRPAAHLVFVRGRDTLTPPGR
jgi:hypothetical protein